MTDTVRVPREPTEAMLQGACDKHKPGQPMSEDRPEECPRFQTRRRIYRAMLAASPQEAAPDDRLQVEIKRRDRGGQRDPEWDVYVDGSPVESFASLTEAMRYRTYRVTEGVKP